jgi:hypothetical protein
VVAFPASIWEQDEAYFSAGVWQFGPTVNHPHPPWFPLWIAIGKVMHSLGMEPGRGLQLASAVLSVWALYPLAAFFGRLVRRELAAVTAATALLLPGPWLLAGRAFSETPATALLALTAALWADDDARRGRLAAGSLAAGACLLVRPQLLLPVLAMAALMVLHRRRLRSLLALLVPGASVLLIGFAAVAVRAGGVAPLRAALAVHASLHFGGMEKSTYAFAASGLARCLVTPLAAGLWVAAAAVGMALLLRHRSTLGVAPGLLTAAVTALAVTIWGLSNPAHPRYAIPLVVLSAAPVVAALAAAVSRAVFVALSGAALTSAWAVLPAAATCRRDTSPPVAAVRTAFAEAEQRAAVVVADPTLVSFVELERLSTGVPVTVLYADQIASGEIPPPPAFATVAVWDDAHDTLAVGGGTRKTLSCTQPLLRRLSQGRFLDLTVASGVTLQPPAPESVPNRP